MPGRAYEDLFELAADQFGYVTQDAAVEAGYSKETLRMMARRGTLDHLGWGLYRFVAFPPNPLDQYLEATFWPRPTRGVLSHETALDLHDLCEVNPAKVHITVPKRYRTNRELPKLYVFHRRDLEENEHTLHEGIPIVTPARAILDGIGAHLRSDLVETAIETGRRRGVLRPADLERIENARG